MLYIVHPNYLWLIYSKVSIELYIINFCIMNKEYNRTLVNFNYFKALNVFKVFICSIIGEYANWRRVCIT